MTIENLVIFLPFNALGFVIGYLVADYMIKRYGS